MAEYPDSVIVLAQDLRAKPGFSIQRRSWLVTCPPSRPLWRDALLSGRSRPWAATRGVISPTDRRALRQLLTYNVHDRLARAEEVGRYQRSLSGRAAPVPLC